MPNSDSGYKWWATNVLVPLVGGGGLVAIVVAYLGRPVPPVTPAPESPAPAVAAGKPAAASPANAASATIPDAPPPAAPHPTHTDAPPDPAVQVQTLASQWLDAWARGDADTVVTKASEPFLLKREFVLTRADLRARYSEIVGPDPANQSNRGSGFQSIKVQKVADLFDPTSQWLAQRVNLAPGDFVVFLEYAGRPGKGVYVLVRRHGESFEVAGRYET